MQEITAKQISDFFDHVGAKRNEGCPKCSDASFDDYSHPGSGDVVVKIPEENMQAAMFSDLQISCTKCGYAEAVKLGPLLRWVQRRKADD